MNWFLLIHHFLDIDWRILQISQYNDVCRQFNVIRITEVGNHVCYLKVSWYFFTFLTEWNTKLADRSLLNYLNQFIYALLGSFLGYTVVIAWRVIRFDSFAGLIQCQVLVKPYFYFSIFIKTYHIGMRLQRAEKWIQSVVTCCCSRKYIQSLLKSKAIFELTQPCGDVLN